MTRDDIVNEVNRLSVGYNVTWLEIQNDADAAIHKINSYLGAEYPLMSQILTAPNSIYALKKDGIYYSIFADIYIRTIVIPYIASEILARDEEFTTIYNKYAMDVENGLFTMFQNEFNRIPDTFKQDDTAGVFFADDFSHGETSKYFEHNKYNTSKHSKGLDMLTEFKIRYHINKDDIIYTADTLREYDDFEYNDTYVLQQIDSNLEFVSSDGVHYYTFAGWYQDAGCSVPADSTGTIIQDIDVYASWNEYNSCVPAPYVTNNNKYTAAKFVKLMDNNLIVPKFVNGFNIDALIYTGCFNNITVSEITKISVPYYGIKYIEPNFFTHFPNLEKIEFYGNASESKVPYNNTLTNKISLITSDNIHNVDMYLINNTQLDWSTRGVLSLRDTKVSEIIIPNSVFKIGSASFIKDEVNYTVAYYSTLENANTFIMLRSGGNGIINNVEITCDCAYEIKPETFNLTNGGYIIENEGSRNFTLYHVTYRKLSE